MEKSIGGERFFFHLRKIQRKKSMEKVKKQNEKSIEKSIGKINGKNQLEKSMGKMVPRGARKKIFTFCSGAE